MTDITKTKNKYKKITSSQYASAYPRQQFTINYGGFTLARTHSWTCLTTSG